MYGILTLQFYVRDIIKYIENKELKEHKNLIIGFSIVVLGGLLLILQLMSTLSSNAQTDLSNYYTLYKLNSFVQQLNTVLINNNYIDFKIVIVLVVIVIMWQLITVKKHAKTMIIFYASILYDALVYVFIYQYRLETTLTLYFIALFCIWIDNIEISSKKTVYVLNTLLVVISLLSFGRIIPLIEKDIYYNYSSSREMANYINTNINTKAIIVAETDYSATSVIAYCDNYLFYSPEREDFFNYIKWDSIRQRILNDEEFREILRNLNNNNDVYLLYSGENLVESVEAMVKNSELIEVYHTEGAITSDEVYYLYKLGDM